ncbi:hypothetical protein CASFOL_022552 [Castilleja foliolosa]|uniref:RNase H type-1 domain-containing protein n=1 Tax=Castilleja foliolosa TaxID=1961234 RepID=A0ABD3CYP5_9LAMI
MLPAKATGQIIRNGFYETKRVEHKVTETDKKCEELIYEFLKQHFPEHKGHEGIRATRMAEVWKPPGEGCFKANSDSSFKDGAATAGIIIRNSNGSIIFASTAKSLCLDSFAAECLALLHACKTLEKLKIKQATLETDSLNAATLINDTSHNYFWSAGPTIELIKRTWTNWPSWRFKFIPRHCNRAAHALASWGSNYF